MTTHVLFVCPHSAGKSIIAVTYFRAAAARLGVHAVADIAGTDPDDVIMPNVQAAIEAQGFAVIDTPRTVSTSDVERADIVVSIGCNHSDVAAESIVEWDVPMLNDDFNASMNSIREHAEALAVGLRT